MSEKTPSAYSSAGVDIDNKMQAIANMRDAVRATYGPEVLAGIGAFGGLFDVSRLTGMRAPVLVASTDGVGTKTMVAAALGSYATLGWDIVNHSINDILVQGAEPLFFLDYIAAPRIDAQVIVDIVSGMAEACKAASCALIGGETAEMPGVYAPGKLDVVGSIVGLVERDRIIDGASIRAGDVALGLPSSGLHTNGYSLVRAIWPPDGAGLQAYRRHVPDLGRTLGEALVAPHRSYLPAVRALRHVVKVKGLAHITGGGFPDNLPRILPEGIGVVIERSAWEVPPLFALIEREGRVDPDEMYRVFNMGMGMVAFVAPEQADAALAAAGEGARIIGRAVACEGEPQVTLA